MVQRLIGDQTGRTRIAVAINGGGYEENMKSKICERCGKEYTPTGYCQKVCANCKYENDLERCRKASKAYHAGGPGSGGNQRGERNSQWKGGTSMFSIRKLESMNGEYFCERCNTDLRKWVKNGEKNGMWVVHHTDHDRENNSLENLELLCKRCHQIEHECWLNFPSNQGIVHPSSNGG